MFAVNHCGGFAFWPTNVTVPGWGRYNYSVAFAGPALQSRDIVAEFVASCKAVGIQAGLYLNLGMNMFLDAGSNGNPHSVVPTGRNQICWDPKGYNKPLLPGQAQVTLEEYQTILLAMMTELLGGGYGNDLAEVWFDGGYPAPLAAPIADLLDAHQPNAVAFQGPNIRSNGARARVHAPKSKAGTSNNNGGSSGSSSSADYNADGKANVANISSAKQPAAAAAAAEDTTYDGNAVRWAGTETGHTPNLDMWSTVADAGPGASGSAFGNGVGDPDGAIFMPAEQDGAIQAGANEGGFWYPGESAKSIAELVAEYEDSVGHNCNFMLELSPDRDGAIPAADLLAYRGFGAVLARCYSLDAAVALTNGTVTTNNQMLTLVLAAGGVDRLLIKEDVEHFGQQVRSYAVSMMAPAATQPPSPSRVQGRGTDNSSSSSSSDGASAAGWTVIAKGASIGHARIHRLGSPLPAGTKLKLELLEVASWPPVIRTFGAFAQSACVGELHQ